MSNEDVIKTKNSLKEITFNKEKTIKLERIVYRWYIRGLVLENAIKKVINEYNLSLNIIKNRNKNKKKNKSTIKII